MLLYTTFIIERRVHFNSFSVTLYVKLFQYNARIKDSRINNKKSCTLIDVFWGAIKGCIIA